MKRHTTITLISFLIVATLVTASMAKSDRWGNRLYNDRLLLRTVVIKKSRSFRVTHYDVNFPGKNAHNPYIVTEVNVIDKNPKDHGYAQIRSGGPGFRYVTLHIKSNRGGGLNFIVEIYGRKS